MILYIKYMVSHRCKMVVMAALQQLDIPFASVGLGTIDMISPLLPGQQALLSASLLPYGLEIIVDKKSILIEKIKHLVIELVHSYSEVPLLNYSSYISTQLGYDYTYLANLFSEVTGTTIQQYIINHKIEKVKELLLYNEWNLTEIARMLHYSSVAHLSNQFKKVTGVTPSLYKHQHEDERKPLENV